MRTCKYCKVIMNDNEENCPLCGAHTDVVDSTIPMVSGEYPEKIFKHSKKITVKHIFQAITVLILLAFTLTSVLTGDWAYIAISGAAVIYLWLGILQYIFYSHTTRQILGGVFFYLILFTNLICGHFYLGNILGTCEVAVNALNISLGLITPILLAILNVVYMMIVFISGKWYRYAFQTISLAIIEIAILVFNLLMGYWVAASIVCSMLGVATIAFSFVFGRDVMFAEFKKRFHI